jgi:hypothetical protein
MAHNLPETRGRGAEYEPYFPSERALTSLLPLTSNYPTTLAIPDYSGRAMAARRKLQPMGAENMAHIFAHSIIVTMAAGNNHRYNCYILKLVGND